MLYLYILPVCGCSYLWCTCSYLWVTWTNTCLGRGDLKNTYVAVHTCDVPVHTCVLPEQIPVCGGGAFKTRTVTTHLCLAYKHFARCRYASWKGPNTRLKNYSLMTTHEIDELCAPWNRRIVCVRMCPLLLHVLLNVNVARFWENYTAYLLSNWDQLSHVMCTCEATCYNTHLSWALAFGASRQILCEKKTNLWSWMNEWMNEWMFNDTPAQKTDRLLLGVKKS